MNKEIKLNLGSGYRPIDGYINIDNRIEVKPDLVCDIIKGLPYKDNSVDEVRAYDILEHIPIGKTIDAITEIWRVLKHNGKFDSFTPDAEIGMGAFQDPTHVSFWVANSWLYYSDKQYRDLYGIKADFEINFMERVNTGKNIFHIFVKAKAVKK